MREFFIAFLIDFQYFVLAYFLVVNLGYLLITLYAFNTVRSGAAATFRHDANLEGPSLDGIRPLSVIVPAFNEQKTILATVQSLLDAVYPEKEVIVIDDGSTDETLDLLLRHFDAVEAPLPIRRSITTQAVLATYVSRSNRGLVIVSKVNGGKADALNVGLQVAQYPLVCAVDADSLLDTDALLRLGQQFTLDKRLVAAGGAVRVLNGCSVSGSRVVDVRAPQEIVSCIQAAEYTRGFLAGRVGWQGFRSLLIISGAFGVFRRDLLLDIGGYRHSVGEDMDLVIRLHRHCVDHDIAYRVGFVPEPVCWTQVPTDLTSLLQQRNRWQRGLVDSLWHSRGMFMNRRYGAVGLLGLPYFLAVELLGPAVEFLGYLAFVVLAMLGMVDSTFALLFLVVAVLLGMWLNASAVLIDNFVLRRYRRVSDVIRIALLGTLEFAGFRQLIAAERLIGTFQSRRRQWGRIQRQSLAPAPDGETHKP